MKTIILFLFITSLSFGQTFFPKKDTIIYNNDGTESHYHVQSNAIQMTTYKNGTWNGPFRGYYRNGKLWVEDNRVNGSIVGKNIEYTPNGDTAKIEEWKNSGPFKRVVFYSSSRKDDQKYYFVSKNGFHVINEGKNIKLGSNTPDSLIEEGDGCEYIWLNGKRKLFSGKEQKKSYMLLKLNKNSKGSENVNSMTNQIITSYDRLFTAATEANSGCNIIKQKISLGTKNDKLNLIKGVIASVSKARPDIIISTASTESLTQIPSSMFGINKISNDDFILEIDYYIIP